MFFETTLRGRFSYYGTDPYRKVHLRSVSDCGGGEAVCFKCECLGRLRSMGVNTYETLNGNLVCEAIVTAPSL